MRLDCLTPDKGSTKINKRRGRGHGSGLGKSAGRGNKGAGQRSGFKKRAWFEGGQMPLSRRLPKRGFTNNFRKEFQIVNLSKLENIDEKIIDANLLFQKGFVRSSLKPIKILGSGNLKSSINVIATAFSKSAKEKIEQSGGKAQVL